MVSIIAGLQKRRIPWGAVLVISLIAMGGWLRSINLASFQPNAADEVSWYLIGTSLIETGVPTSWTIFPHSKGFEYRDCQMVVTPFLGHPPLFSLLVGSVAVWDGNTDWCQINLGLVRRPMLVIAVLSIWTTYLLAKKLFNEHIAWFTLLAFVFFPSHFITTRLIAAEHLLGFFLILGLYWFMVWEQLGGRRRGWLTTGLAAICLLSPLFKLTGLGVSGSLVMLAFHHNRKKLAVGLIAATLISLLVFAFYGWWYDWEVFVAISQAHGARLQSLEHFWSIFTHLDVAGFSFFDVSILVGMIGLIGLAANSQWSRQAVFISLPLVVLSFFFLYIAPWESYGWYKYVLYPMIAIGLGYVFNEGWEGSKLYLILLMLLMGVMMEKSGFFPGQMEQRIVMGVIFAAVSALMLWVSDKFVIRSTVVVMLALLFFFEAIWSLSTLGVICLPGICK